MRHPAAAADLDVAIGKATFDRLWVPAPASTTSADGLGPLFAARSCAGCHAQGGRASFRLGRDDPATHPGLVIRLGDAHGAADRVYGAELQPEGAGGVTGEGRATVRLAAAEAGRPPKPEWRVEGWAYGAPEDETRASPRVAPSLDGLGLLARVPESEILAREDADDRDGDGVSGRAARASGGIVGRFGWKAARADARGAGGGRLRARSRPVDALSAPIPPATARRRKAPAAPRRTARRPARRRSSPS